MKKKEGNKNRKNEGRRKERYTRMKEKRKFGNKQTKE